MTKVLKIGIAVALCAGLISGCTVTSNGKSTHYSASDIISGIKSAASGQSNDAETDLTIPSSPESTTVQASTAAHVLPQANSLSWDKLLHASMKMDSSFDYQQQADSYMKKFRYKVWDKYRNDEFELDEKRQETILIMKSRSEKFDPSALYVINTTFSIGSYDFNKSLFPLDSLSEGTHYKYSQNRTYGLPYAYKVKFSNPSLIGDIHMTKNNANKFIKSRKNSYGNVNRNVYSKLFFTISQIEDGGTEFIAKLKSAYIYADKENRNLLHKYQ